MGFVPLNTMTQASSWSDALKQYTISKHQHVAESTVKPERVTHKQKLAEASSYNPITQRFRDERKEERIKEYLDATLPARINDAYDKQMSREQHFNVLSHEPRRGHVHERAAERKVKPPSLVTASRQQYDIISTVGYDKHHWAPEGHRPPPPDPVPDPKPAHENARPREFDIVKNTFVRNHESKMAKEGDEARTQILDNFWKKRDFNLLTCSYYDEDKERDFVKERDRRIKEDAGRNYLAKLPPTLANSDSLMYDIATGVIRDPERLAEKEARKRAALEAKSSGKNFEQDVRTREDFAAVRDQERKLGRVADSRFRQTYDRGYHILSNEGFDKTGMPPPPRTNQRASLQMVREDEAKRSRVSIGSTNRPSSYAFSQKGSFPAPAGSAASSRPASTLSASALPPKLSLDKLSRGSSVASSIARSGVRSAGFGTPMSGTGR